MVEMFDSEPANTVMVWGDEPTDVPDGSPTGLYRAHFAVQATKLCLLGARSADLADFFQVQPATIDQWIRRYPDFAYACHHAQLVADGEVVQSLYRMATGQATVRRVKVVVRPKSDRVDVVEYTEQLPPSVAAATTWLEARRPEQWLPKRFGAAPLDDALTELTDAELRLVASGRTLPTRRPGVRSGEDV